LVLHLFKDISEASSSHLEPPHPTPRHTTAEVELYSTAATSPSPHALPSHLTKEGVEYLIRVDVVVVAAPATADLPLKPFLPCDSRWVRT